MATSAIGCDEARRLNASALQTLVSHNSHQTPYDALVPQPPSITDVYEWKVFCRRRPQLLAVSAPRSLHGLIIDYAATLVIDFPLRFAWDISSKLSIDVSRSLSNDPAPSSLCWLILRLPMLE